MQVGSLSPCVIIRGQNDLRSVAAQHWKMVLPGRMKGWDTSQEYFWDIFRTRWLRRWHVCVCGVHTVCGDQMKDGCARAAKWKMGPFLGQKRPMFAPPPSVWGNPWTHFSRSDLSLPNRQLLTGYFWLALIALLQLQLDANIFWGDS